MIARTPEPPYYAVIFSNFLEKNTEGYNEMADKMIELAQKQDGYLGHESVRDGMGITISYWESEVAIKNWRQHAEHILAQKAGIEMWYRQFCTRVCKVRRQHFWERS